MRGVSVNFQVFVSREITEHDAIEDSDLLVEFEKYRPVLAGTDYHYGSLSFRSEAAEAVFEDQLWYIIGNLCFRSIPALAVAGEFHTNLYMNLGYILMRRKDDSVHIENDEGVNIDVPWPEIAPTLVACGERFIRFMKLLNARPVHAKFVEMLEQEHQSALSIL